MTMAPLRAAVLLSLVVACAGQPSEGGPWVRDVRFVGVKSIDSRQLRLQTEGPDWRRRPRQQLDLPAVDLDRERIEAYYRSRGFFRARVADVQVTPTNHGVRVTFLVDEGEPTRIESLQLEGLDRRDPLAQKFAQALPLGKRFEHGEYLRAREALQMGLEERGHAWVALDDRVEVNRDHATAKVIMLVDPGPVVRFSRVEVDGVEHVSASAVARRSGIRHGQRFSPEALELARGRLQVVGTFSSVQVEIVRDEDYMAEVHIHVREGAPNDLALGAGLSLESERNEAYASFLYTRYHWLGGLRTLRLTLEPGWVAMPTYWEIDRTGPALLAEASLTQPDWPCRRCALTAMLGFDLGIEYAYQYYGPRTQIAINSAWWHERFQIGASYNLEVYQFFNTNPSVFTDPAQAGRVYGFTSPYRLGWWQEDFILDLRDHPLATHRGGYFGLSLEQGGEYAGGAFQYQKVTPDVRGYAPLGSRVTLAGRVQFGQLFSQSDLGSPVTQRYYLGGPSSHRGFTYNRLSRQIPSGTPGGAPLPIGGDQMFLFQVELRANVVHVFGDWLSVAAFLDAGDVGAPSCGVSCGPVVVPGGVDWGNLNYAVGGGLRYRTVLGSVRFDVAARLNRLSPFEPDGTPNADPGERWAFHLSLGEAF